MSLAIRSSVLELPSAGQMPVWNDVEIPKIISSFASHAVDACVAIVKRSSTVEPTFVWKDYSSFEISPSSYQHWVVDGQDLVTLEEDDAPLRAYCVQAADALDHYRQLDQGWDGGDMPAPDHKSLDDAYKFLAILSSEIDECVSVAPMLDHEGIASLAIEHDTAYCSVAFYGNSEIVTYHLNRTNDHSFTSMFSMDETQKLSELIDFCKVFKD